MTTEEFTQLFDLYFNDIRKYLLYRSGDETIATDIAQDAFMRIWEKQMVIEQKTAKNLLIKIARDLYINRYHKEKKAFRFFETYQIDEKGLTPEDQLNFEALKEAYENALKTMPEKQREVFLMSRIDELKYKEIADQLGLSVKAIEKRMSLALAHLKTHLRDQVNHIVLWFTHLFFCITTIKKREGRSIT
ncbi:RNA polymerase sigma factor [Mangrovibacterium marinum]|uniref:RNA polymerase sigma-70 factor (ECF subfamily) n=1 Tax=Mangrovibacterium marinum TaxID=1639118 RepID=A0A2T5BVY6_9BACT|nr:sigma-70 family RNA polymerase sigma factor [Mangrovibacterium marinum]PTN03790.1 RNA polymerase sigma-70 factor (ECF subfamily) [Mangrovibacterium marinum]